MTVGTKTRLDVLLVERGLFPSRERARAYILAGRVLINEQKVDKPGTAIAGDAAVRLLGDDMPYVSRGGLKLAAALTHWQIAVGARACLDVGTSTGGFTDCLLQNGARKVYAVDVAYGQLDWKLRQDPRVIVKEKTNARHLKPENFPSPADLAVIDCSFISLKKILPPAVPLLQSAGKIIALIKPQFEAGKAEVDKGRGVITDAAIHERVLTELRDFVGAQAGLCWRGVVESPLLGPAGNKEFLALIEKC